MRQREPWWSGRRTTTGTDVSNVDIQLWLWSFCVQVALRAFKHISFGGEHHDFIALKFKNVGEIIDVGEDKIQVAKLAASAEIRNAIAHKQSVYGSIAPAIDDRTRFLVDGNESGVHKASGDPGTADLVFFPELATCTGANNRHFRMMLDEVLNLRGEIAKARYIARRAAFGCSDDLRARRGQENHWPLDVIVLRHHGWAVGNFKTSRHIAAQLSNHQGIVEIGGQRQS